MTSTDIDDIFYRHSVAFIGAEKYSDIEKIKNIKFGDIIAIRKGHQIIAIATATTNGDAIENFGINFLDEERSKFSTDKPIPDNICGVKVNNIHKLNAEESKNIFSTTYEKIERFCEIKKDNCIKLLDLYYKEWKELMNINETIKILKQKKQIILQGAPGTGKTYTTAELAVSMIDGEVDNDRVKLMARYKELVGSKRIFFTTFHQSMDCEEFIEGYKPKEEEGGFKLQDGIFREACRKAEETNFDSKHDFNIDDEINKFVNLFKNNSEEEIIDEDTKIEYHYINPNKNNAKTKIIKFECYISNNNEISFKIIYNEDAYKKKEKSYSGHYPISFSLLKTMYIEFNTTYKKRKNETYYPNFIFKYMNEKFGTPLPNEISKPIVISEREQPVILIIDEINRGNISKIFGELITLLEADKRSGALNEIELKLPYSGEYFSVPPNLYIIGTMNTADRTIGYIDYALRRRFAFITVPADKSKVSPIAQKLFDDVQSIVSENISNEFEADDLMIGHSYFIVKTQDELEMKLEYEIKPLLLEYLKDGILIDRDML